MSDAALNGALVLMLLAVVFLYVAAKTGRPK